MKTPENDKWLDEALSEAIGAEKSRTDFEQWKQKHPEAVEKLTLRANRQAVSPGPLTKRRIIMSNRSKAWKVAAVVAVVICAGAIATTVGLKVRKYYFVGREPDGTYVFKTEPEDLGDGRTRSRKAGTWVDPNRTIDVEQTRRDFEEIDLLRQQDARELVGVGEKEVNGKLQPRSFIFKYVLADGREKRIGEGDPDTQDREDSLTATEEDELLRLRLQRVGKEEYIGNDLLGEVRGRIFVFKRQRFVLSDGTEIIVSTGKPKDD